MRHLRYLPLGVPLIVLAAIAIAIDDDWAMWVLYAVAERLEERGVRW